MTKYGEFCKVYGATLRNRLIEYMLEMGKLDFAVGDLAQETNISRPKAYQIIDELLSEGMVKKARIVGRTQLFTLDYSDPKVKLLKKSFDDCLKLVGDTISNPLKELSSDFANKPMSKSRFVKVRSLFEHKI